MGRPQPSGDMPPQPREPSLQLGAQRLSRGKAMLGPQPDLARSLTPCPRPGVVIAQARYSTTRVFVFDPSRSRPGTLTGDSHDARTARSSHSPSSTILAEPHGDGRHASVTRDECRARRATGAPPRAAIASARALPTGETECRRMTVAVPAPGASLSRFRSWSFFEVGVSNGP